MKLNYSAGHSRPTTAYRYMALLLDDIWRWLYFPWIVAICCFYWAFCMILVFITFLKYKSLWKTSQLWQYDLQTGLLNKNSRNLTSEIPMDYWTIGPGVQIHWSTHICANQNHFKAFLHTFSCMPISLRLGATNSACLQDNYLLQSHITFMGIQTDVLKHTHKHQLENQASLQFPVDCTVRSKLKLVST